MASLSHIALAYLRDVSIILKLVHPLAKTVGAKWVWARGRRYHIYMKLDPVKVEWIVRQKGKGARNATIAASMKVSVRRVQELWSAYRSAWRSPS